MQTNMRRSFIQSFDWAGSLTLFALPSLKWNFPKLKKETEITVNDSYQFNKYSPKCTYDSLDTCHQFKKTTCVCIYMCC